jgi:hypothetical protein
VRHVPYMGGTALGRVEGTLEELEQRAIALRDAGWLAVVVRLDAPDSDCNRKVRRLLPNAVSVDVVLPAPIASPRAPPPPPDGSPFELYRAYHLEAHGCLPSDDVIERFASLLAEIEETT